MRKIILTLAILYSLVVIKNIMADSAPILTNEESKSLKTAYQTSKEASDRLAKMRETHAKEEAELLDEIALKENRLNSIYFTICDNKKINLLRWELKFDADSQPIFVEKNQTKANGQTGNK